METTQSISSINKKFLINVVITPGGGGHYATYQALRSVIEEQQLPWEFSITDVEELAQRLAEQKMTLDFYRFFGTTAEKTTNNAQKKGWQWIQNLTLPLNKLLVKLNYKAGLKMLEEDWRKQKPDLVVSVVPFFNKALWDSLQRVKPGTPVVTILTDLADSPPAFWIEPETENYVICGTKKAVEQAYDLGVKEERIVKTSGMVINPRFYEPQNCDRQSERQSLGLDPDCLTGVVLFGSYGHNSMLEIAKNLECFQQKLQLIFICGRNEELAAALSNYKGNQKRFVTGFTKDIPYYMHLSDFFIGKPGPGSISEAIAMNLPVIVERNLNTLPQERYNAQWVRQKQVGLVIPNYRQINKAVETLLDADNYARYRENVAAINNQAVFEITDILQNILANSYQKKEAQLVNQINQIGLTQK